ncbi:MAG: hypothetical protein EU529_12665 [Promethearchaeota archaeon]|nr:MAG: hypothetical protein EU529_12665 [Candidatus Lokiarchaeota archaeon]
MEEILKQLQLSSEAIKIYEQCLKHLTPLTYNELYSIIPDLSFDDFKKIIDELINHNLLIQIKPQNPEILIQYLALPPIKPILNFHLNLASNFQENIQRSTESSLNQIFEESEIIELDSFLNKFLEIRKDVSEDGLIQKQDVEEIIAEFERFTEIQNNLSELKDLLPDLSQKMIRGLHPKFANLLEDLPKIKNKTGVQESLEKSSIEVEELIKNQFKEMEALIEETTIEPVKTKIKDSFQYVKDFKLLYLNVISNFEKIMNKIQQMILQKKNKFEDNLKGTENLILEKLNFNIQELFKPVSGFSTHIGNIMQQFEVYSKNLSIDNLWLIKSKSRIIDEITTIISNSKNEIMFILPKIEDFLNIEQFQNIPKNLRIKMGASNPHTNSLVKKYKEMKVEYKNIQNENRVFLKGDNDYIIVGLVKEDSKNPLENIIGIGSNFKPLINVFSPIIEASWNAASSDTYAYTKGVHTPKMKGSPKEMPQIEKKETSSSTYKTPVEPIKTQKIEPSQKSNASDLYPINTAFNLVIKRLDTMSGVDFSKALQRIADLILEKIGSSVHLLRIKDLINKYKDQTAPISSQQNISEIIGEIEEIKKKIL